MKIVLSKAEFVDLVSPLLVEKYGAILGEKIGIVNLSPGWSDIEIIQLKEDEEKETKENA